MPGKVTNPSRVPRNAVLLSKVPSLTLRDGKMTASRRVAAAPQLECIGPKHVCKLYKVDVMRCTNDGADYDAENIQWSCKASLPEEFKLGSTDVVCEGYESSDDPYVLKGSCGVEYRLLLTDKGEAKYGKKPMFQWSSSPSPSPSNGSGSKAGSIVFFLIFVVVLLVILNGIWSSWNQNPRRRPGFRPNRGGGGGGNNDDDDPPPPYDGPPPYYRQPTKPKPQTTTPRSNATAQTSSSRSAPREGQQQGWRPGFWTGTAAGAAAAYYAASRNQSPREPPRSETQQRPGGWFSNFGASPRREQPWHNPAASSSSSSNQAPTYSTTQHESTGFGGTRRR